MKFLFPYLNQYKKPFVLSLLFATITQLFVCLDPYIFKLLIDNYILKTNEYQLKEFLLGAGQLILAAIISSLISRFSKTLQDYYTNSVAQRVGSNLYTKGITHTIKLPYSSISDHSSGETLNILQKTRQDVEKLILMSVNTLFSAIVAIALVLFYTIQIHWLITVIYLVTIPILLLISFKLSKKVKNTHKKILKQSTLLSGSTTESFRNIEIIKTMGLTEQETKRLNIVNDKILTLQLLKVRFTRTINYIQGSLNNFLLNGMLLFIIYLIYKNMISVGEFFSLYLYSSFIFRPLYELPSMMNNYREAEVSLDNLSKFLNINTVNDNEKKIVLSKVKNLSFNKVSFQYKNSFENTLENISFQVNIGQTIAFVGPSGAGKTTLIKLIMSLYTPSEGEILFNDIPTEQLDLEIIRQNIGYVTQDTQLFSGSVRSNLHFSNVNASDEDCLKALRLARCHRLVSISGLDTLIGENGLKLSGGEKQRLSIARALLRSPGILIFDEATSALDSLTENEIIETIRDISDQKRHLTVIITHRLSTVIDVDQIYVLDKGKILENGTHEELIGKSKFYGLMWNQQTDRKSNTHSN